MRFFSLVFAILICAVSAQVSAEELDYGIVMDVPYNKVWEIEFSEAVDVQSLHHIKVRDEQGVNVPVEVTAHDEIYVKVVPRQQYKENIIYELEIPRSVQNKSGQSVAGPVTQKFMVESTEQTNLYMGESVQVEYDLVQLSEIEKNGETIFTFKDPDGSYALHKGSGLIIKRTSKEDMALEVQEVMGDGAGTIISGVERPAITYYEDIWVDEEINITAKDIIVDAEEGYAVRDVLEYNRETQKLETKLVLEFKDVERRVGARLAILNGKITIDNFKTDTKLKSKFGNVNSATLALSGTMHHDLEITYALSSAAVDLTKELGKKKEGLEIGQDLLKVELPIPNAPLLQTQIGLELFLEAEFSGGGKFNYRNSTDFKIGYMYKDGKSYKIKEQKKAGQAFSAKGHAEIDVYAGIRANLNLVPRGFEDYIFVNVYSSFGPSLKAGFYLDLLEAEQSVEHTDSVCFKASVNLKGQIGLKILPQHEVFKAYFEISTKDKIIDEKNCNILRAITVDQDTLTIERGKSKKVNVKAHVNNVANDEPSKNTIKDITNDVIYTTSSKSLTIKNGEITAKHIEKEEKANVTVVYEYEGKRYEKTIAVHITVPNIIEELPKPEPELPMEQQLTVSQLEKQMANTEGSLSSTSLFNHKKHYITIEYERIYSLNVYDEPDASIITVYELNEQTNLLEKVYSKYLDGGYVLYEEYPHLIRNNNASLIFYAISGSEAFLNFIVVGSKDEKLITTLLDESEGYYGHGSMDITDQHIMVCEGENGKQFSWENGIVKTVVQSCQRQ